MAIDGVPLFMGGDEVEHSSELLRTLVWAIFRGQEGYLTSVAGRCKTRLTPGEGVRLLPGPFVINSRYAGGQLQAYLMRIINDEDVPTTAVPPGFPGGFRYDLVVCNVEDPYPSDGVQWPLPQDADVRRLGPYWRPRVIENVPSNCVSLEQIPVNHPSGARSWTALPSARLKRPANTATVTNDMITPLNPVLNLVSGVSITDEMFDQLEDMISDVQDKVGDIASGKIPIPGEYVRRRGCTDGSNRLLYTETAFKTFPKEGAFDVMIPTWATHAEIFAVISSVWQGATAANMRAHVYGESRIRIGIGTSTVSDNTAFDTDEMNDGDNRPPPPGDSTNYDHGTKLYRPGNRIHLFPSGSMPIPSSMRGTKQTFRTEARMFPDRATQGKLIADNASTVYLEVKFKEKP